MAAAYPRAMTGAHFRCPKKVYLPRAWPMRATPAAEPMESMLPEMSQGQWLLVTLTAGVGGSMLSIGSAAGVALMGQARGRYTFFGHLKWAPVIALGYAASIYVHFLVNGSRF